MQETAIQLTLPCSFQGCKEARTWPNGSSYCIEHSFGWDTCESCKGRFKRGELVRFSSSFQLKEACKTCTRKICELNKGTIDEQGNRLPQASAPAKAGEEKSSSGSWSGWGVFGAFQDPVPAAKAPTFIQSSFTLTSWKAVNMRELQGS